MSIRAADDRRIERTDSGRWQCPRRAYLIEDMTPEQLAALEQAEALRNTPISTPS
jgi:hypothetical protein